MQNYYRNNSSKEVIPMEKHSINSNRNNNKRRINDNINKMGKNHENNNINRFDIKNKQDTILNSNNHKNDKDNNNNNTKN